MTFFTYLGILLAALLGLPLLIGAGLFVYSLFTAKDGEDRIDLGCFVPEQEDR